MKFQLRKYITCTKISKTTSRRGGMGLPLSFIRHSGEFKKCYKESINNSSLSPSQRIGVLKLIPKPKLPSELVYIKNWRPITFLNLDYKIFTHLIKNIIFRSLPYIISKLQSGFQAGKSTCDNLILMYVITTLMKKASFSKWTSKKRSIRSSTNFYSKHLNF